MTFVAISDVHIKEEDDLAFKGFMDFLSHESINEVKDIYLLVLVGKGKGYLDSLIIARP